MDEKLRIVVVGASGIGKHHAKWWHQIKGCEVVGFLGSNEANCASTEHTLRELFGFAGKGYWDMEKLLSIEHPHIVDVCVPNEQHFNCVLQALDSGAHVLCEKPLIWHEGETVQRLLERGRILVDRATKAGLHFGICTQYAAALTQYLQLYEPVHGPIEHISTFYAEMETVARGRQRDAVEVWIDMGPHPLTLLLSWIPNGYVVPSSLQKEFFNSEAHIVCDFADGENLCHCEIIVRDLQEGKPTRCFGVNDFLVDCTGRNDAGGVYRSVLQREDREVVGEDFMALLIARFADVVKGVERQPLVTGEMGLRNLELQLQFMPGTAS
tara:strand:- start:1893 stop:2867 length:975 start_codon:yes stop_codon:yes gene_type:complete